MNQHEKYNIEKRVLKWTVGVTLILALVRIAFGLYLGSLSISFDGLFDLFDTATVLLSLWVVHLLSRPKNRRFQFGLWHVEPMVLVLNGLILIFLCVYAFLRALNSLMSGGRLLPFNEALVFISIMTVLNLAMYRYINRKNALIGSNFLKLDAQSWLISFCIDLSLVISFIIATFLEGGSYAYYARYVDPFILALMTLVLLFIPLPTVFHALRDMLRIAPKELDAQITKTLDSVVKTHGFKTYSSYIEKSGRAHFIEVHFILPKAYPLQGVESLDLIRHQIWESLSKKITFCWLTVVFTTDDVGYEHG